MEPSHNSHYRNSLQATSSVPQAKGNQPIKIILKLNPEKKTLKIQLQFQLHPMAVLPCSTTAFVLWLCSISLHPHLAIAPGDWEQLHSITWPAPCEMSLCFEKPCNTYTNTEWMKGGIQSWIFKGKISPTDNSTTSPCWLYASSSPRVQMHNFDWRQSELPALLERNKFGPFERWAPDNHFGGL